MHFTCDAHSLLEGLNIVTRALAPRAAKPILEGVLLETSSKGLQLTCTDGNVTIQSLVEAQISAEGSVVLPGRLFTEIVRKLPGGMATVKVNENLSSTITCGKSKTNLAGMSAIDFPMAREMEHGFTITMAQKQLKDMISKVVFSIATDESRQVLTGCLFEVTANEARMVALDGFRLALQIQMGTYDLPQGEERVNAIIPGKVAQELSKILEDSTDEVTLTLEKNYLMASFGQTELLTILLAGEYINYRQILPQDFSSKVKVNRGEFADAIDRASLMAREGKNNLIHMHIEDENMRITSNAEMGNVLEEVSVVLEGKEMDIAFNARYLTDVIRNVEKNEFCMCFNSNVSPCVVRPIEGEDYLYLILPVRTFNS